MQMQSALDDSLLDRAERAAEAAPCADASYNIPSWMLGAADVRMVFITENRRAPLRRRPDTSPSAARARGVAAGSAVTSSAPSRRGGTATAWSPCPPSTGKALVLAQSLESPGARPAQARPRDAALRGRGHGGRRPGGLGRRPQRSPPGAPADRAAEDIARTEDLTRSRSKAPTRSPGCPRVQRDAGRARRVPRPAAAAGRRRRPRAAHAADLAAHQPRPAHPGRPATGGMRLRRRGPSCSTTYTPRSRS